MPALPLLDAWIFDMDATLTVGKHDFEAMRQALGLPANQAILESIEAKEPPEREALLEALADWEWEIARQTEPAPGAPDLLSRLKTQGRPLAILTRNRRDIALHTLEAAGLMPFFEPELVLGRDCASPKPSPAGIFEIFKRWGDPQQKVAMVGDYLFDLQAGRAAQCFTIHVSPEPKGEWGEFVDLFVPGLPQLLPQIPSGTVQG